MQNIYRSWALFGIVLFANLIVTAALAVKVSEQHGPFALVLTSLTCQVAALAIFFVFVYPGNVATDNWTTGSNCAGVGKSATPSTPLSAWQASAR